MELGQACEDQGMYEGFSGCIRKWRDRAQLKVHVFCNHETSESEEIESKNSSSICTYLYLTKTVGESPC